MDEEQFRTVCHFIEQAQYLPIYKRRPIFLAVAAAAQSLEGCPDVGCLLHQEQELITLHEMARRPMPSGKDAYRFVEIMDYDDKTGQPLTYRELP